jgi:homoserine O-acetyltransferase
MVQGARMIGAAIAVTPTGSAPTDVSHASHTEEPTSIFFAQRLDYEMILRLLPEGASVVDFGCGNGELLAILRERGHAPLLGVDCDLEDVVDCVGRGLDAIHADLDEGLGAIPDQSFDVALLSQTLQSIVDVAGVLRDIVRVGRRGIVSFPNFAYKPLREMFLSEGRLPKEEGLYAYDWHDTPNRRFPSIRDFQELCAELDIRILDAIYADSRTGMEVESEPNLHADIAIVALARG